MQPMLHLCHIFIHSDAIGGVLILNTFCGGTNNDCILFSAGNENRVESDRQTRYDPSAYHKSTANSWQKFKSLAGHPDISYSFRHHLHPGHVFSDPKHRRIFIERSVILLKDFFSNCNIKNKKRSIHTISMGLERFLLRKTGLEAQFSS